MLVLLTALVVAASLDTTTADEEIPWITEVLMREAIPFDEDKTAVEMKVSWSDAIAANKYMWYNVDFLDSDTNVKIGFGVANPAMKNEDGTPLPLNWALNPCSTPRKYRMPLPENIVYSEGESIWTVWKEDGKLNILYNGEDFLRDGYPGVTEGLDCLNPTAYPDGQWKPDWEAELKSVRFSGYNEGKKLDGYRFIPIPVDAEPENDDESDGDETHGDDSHGSYSGTTVLSCSAEIVTALLMAAFF